MVLQQVASLPAALTIFAIIGFGVLFGLLGAVLATPLAVLVAVAVRNLYLREEAEEDERPLARPPRSEQERAKAIH